MSKSKRWFLSVGLALLSLFVIGWLGTAHAQADGLGEGELEYKTLAEADGKLMGVTTGTVLDLLTQKYLPHSPYSYFNNYTDCLAALKTGKVEGFLCDEPVAREISRKNPDVGYIKEAASSDMIGVGISNAKPELKAILDAGIARYEKDGTLKSIDELWYSNSEDKKVLPVSKTGSKGKVICGLNAECPPMDYISHGDIVGYEPDLVVRIMQDAGYEVELKNMDFNALVPSVVSGKVDIIIGAISITEERKKSILFSEPIYHSGIVLVVRQTNVGNGKADFWGGIKESFYRNFIMEDRYQMIFQGLKVTIIITIFAAIFGTILGFFVCMLWRSPYKIVSVSARIFVKVMQGTPLVVFLMIMYYIVFGKSLIDPVYVAIAAFAINMAAYVSQMMRSGIDAVDKGQQEAAYAMGFTKVQTFVKIVAPQALKYILPVYTGEFISLLKSTAIVGYIAIQDLTKMSDIIRSRTYEAFFPLIVTALIYLAVSWGLALMLTYLEYRIDPKKRPRTLKGVKL